MADCETPLRDRKKTIESFSISLMRSLGLNIVFRFREGESDEVDALLVYDQRCIRLAQGNRIYLWPTSGGVRGIFGEQWHLLCPLGSIESSCQSSHLDWKPSTISGPFPDIPGV